MTITFPRALPDGISIRKQKFDLDDNQTAFQSPFSRQQQTQNLNAGTTDRWTGIWTTPILSPDQIRTMRAWLTSMKGQLNTFYAYDYDAKLPSTYIASDDLAGDSTVLAGDSTVQAGIGAFPNLGLVDGSGQTGTSLNVKGFTASSTILGAGDYFQVNNQLFMLLEDLVTDGSGLGIANFEPAIRISPADGDLIITANTVMIAKMQEPYAGWETDQLKLGVVSFAFEEDLNG